MAVTHVTCEGLPGCKCECQVCQNARVARAKREGRSVADELKVTKDRVVKAAATCGDAARVLKELFPEAFTEETGYLTFTKAPERTKDVNGNSQYPGIEVRNGGNYKGGLYLSNMYSWSIVTDDQSMQVLVGRKK